MSRPILSSELLRNESDTMHEMIEELKEKRKELSIQADVHRQKRDILNKKTREAADTRDNYNRIVRKNLARTRELREKRNNTNEKVKESKKQRDINNKKYRLLQKQITTTQKEMMPQKGKSFRILKRELNKLEHQQQTQVLKPTDEKKLIESIKEIADTIREREKEFEQDETTKDLIAECRLARKTAEDEHKNVEKFADEAQKDHEEMIQLYDETKKFQKEADKKQKDFIKSKLAADEEHRGHTLYMEQIRDLDKVISNLVRRRKKVTKRVKEDKIKEEAQALFDQFKKGGKLSTADLLQFQKAGEM